MNEPAERKHWIGRFDKRWALALYHNQRGLLFLGLALLLGLVGYWIGSAGRQESDEKGNESAVATEVTADQSIWTCSMHPQIRQPGPGDCPLCGMDLIPVQASGGGLRTLAISPETRALMNIAVTPVERKYVAHEVRMVGKVDYDETTLGYIAARVPGRLDRLYVDYTGVKVNKGDHMVYIYSPELYSAQQELIQALRFRNERQGTTTRLAPTIDLVNAAREKLRLLGLTEEQVGEIEKQETPSDHLTIFSLVSGVVIEKLKKEGDYVKTGERIYTVADLNQVWVHLDAYESDLPWIRYGQQVTIATEAYPGEEFQGRIAFIQPVVNDRTRTVKLRVNVPNRDGKLKPDMFVHAVVRPQVATAGRVIDPGLAGKWISPMHPEIIKDEPGDCDICGMPLVRAESLGFVQPGLDEQPPPLVIPYSAALVTGRRAVVYVELPVMPERAESAFQQLQAAVDAGDLSETREAFAALSNVLDDPYDQPATNYARRLWDRFADQLAAPVLAGRRAESKSQATEAFVSFEAIMNQAREEFGPQSQPTYEGREIVLGPRAGDYYLVRSSLEEGELVVTNGSFKLDAEIQIQAKPSMMTPTGGGGRQHDHSAQTALPTAFRDQLQDLESAFEAVGQAVEAQQLAQIQAAFQQFGQTLETIEGESLSGDARMQWKEFSMLLGNDAVEGSDLKQLDEADRVYLLLKGHMRRMRDQMGIHDEQMRKVERIDVPQPFQLELAKLWDRYLAIQEPLAADKFSQAKSAVPALNSALEQLDDESLSGSAAETWRKEKANLQTLVEQLQQTDDLKAMRASFKPLSEEIGVLAKAFGFGSGATVFELHCPMAFQGKGATWYQSGDQVRNPYFGASMLKCADRVDKLTTSE